MILERIHALAYLGYRAVVAHPLKRLLWTGTGKERFLAAYLREGLPPTRPEDREVRQAASACISCGLCDNELRRSPEMIGPSGMVLHAAFRLYSKSDMALVSVGGGTIPHPAPANLEAVCPTGVPVSNILAHLARCRANRTT